MSQPKIAILMIGNMRSYNITFRSFESYLFQPYNCDIYVTTYDKRFDIKNGTNIREEVMTEEAIKNVYGKYLKHITILNRETFIEHYNRVTGKHYTFEKDLDRLYTIEKIGMTAYDIFLGECSRNNRHYDYIIKMRPDVLLNEKWNLNLSINDNQIIVPNNDSGGGFNDHIAFGRQKVMERYLTYYSNFHDIDRKNECDVSIIEAGLRKNLELAKIEILRIPLKYTLLRDIKPQKIIFTGKKQFFVKKY